MNNYDFSKDSIMLEVEQNLDKTLKLLNSTRYNINENYKMDMDINTMMDINNFKHSKSYSIINEYVLNYETIKYIHEIAKIETMEDLELAMNKISKTSSAPEKFSKIFKILSYLSSIAILGGGGYSIVDYIKSNASTMTWMTPTIASIAGIGGVLALVGISLYGIDKIFSLFDYISKFIYWLCVTICKLITRNEDIDLERKKIMIYSMLSDIEQMMKNRMNLNELEYLMKSKKYLESELLYLKS